MKSFKLIPEYSLGTIEVKKDMVQYGKHAGDIGIITAFIPKQNIYSIFFDDQRWITFEWNLTEINENFKYELYNKKRRYIMMQK